VAGFIHFANGVHGVLECGAGAPDVPEVDYWWRKCRIGAQGTDGFAEVLTGGGWRAVTKGGACSGEGSMNYDLDMPPYIQEMAGWLDDESRVHSCNFAGAYKGFEIMMAFCRSAAEGGRCRSRSLMRRMKMELLRRKLPEKKILLAIPASAKNIPRKEDPACTKPARATGNGREGNSRGASGHAVFAQQPSVSGKIPISLIIDDGSPVDSAVLRNPCYETPFSFPPNSRCAWQPPSTNTAFRGKITIIPMPSCLAASTSP